MEATSVNTNKREEWFDELISTLRVHELELNTGTASPKVTEFYEALISNDLDYIFKTNKAASQRYFVQRIILEYLQLLGDKLPSKLAFDFNDSEVLVWAEIADDNEVEERLLTLAEAKINAKFHPYGFDMETMIVEKLDNVPVPNHYKMYKS